MNNLDKKQQEAVDKAINHIVFQAKKAGLHSFILGFKADLNHISFRFENIRASEAMQVVIAQLNHIVKSEMARKEYTPEYRKIFQEFLLEFQQSVNACNKKFAAYNEKKDGPSKSKKR